MSERTREREREQGRELHIQFSLSVCLTSVWRHTDTHLELQSAKRQQHKKQRKESETGRVVEITSLTPETAAGLETKKGERIERQHVFSL